MHDALFGHQTALEPAQIKEYAKSVGLDDAKYTQCLESKKNPHKCSATWRRAKR